MGAFHSSALPGMSTTGSDSPTPVGGDFTELGVRYRLGLRVRESARSRYMAALARLVKAQPLFRRSRAPLRVAQRPGACR
jgi:hypothetical protein